MALQRGFVPSSSVSTGALRRTGSLLLARSLPSCWVCLCFEGNSISGGPRRNGSWPLTPPRCSCGLALGRDEPLLMTEDVRLLEADDPDMLLLHDFELGRPLQPVEISLSNGSASPVTRLLVATQKSFMEPLELSPVEAIKWWWASVETRLRNPRIEWIARPWVVQIPLLEPGETKRFRLLTYDPGADLQVVFYTFRTPLPWVFNEDVGLVDPAATLRAMPAARCKLIWLQRRPPRTNTGKGQRPTASVSPRR